MNKVKEIVTELLNNKSAIQITTDGEITEVKPSGKEFTLEELYKLTNCDIVECVYLPNEKIMIVDEEGRLRSHPKVNLLATMIVSSLSVNFMPICGDVVIVNEKQFS